MIGFQRGMNLIFLFFKGEKAKNDLFDFIEILYTKYKLLLLRITVWNKQS